MAIDKRPNRPPISLAAMLDSDFIAYRAMLLDVAAFLDRCDRIKKADSVSDPRLEALVGCLPTLMQHDQSRARKILEQLSDLSTLPLDGSPGGAAGGVPPNRDV